MRQRIPKRLTSEPRVVNLVATAELGQVVKLERLANIEGILYDTAIYRCAYLKDKNTKSKVSIFSTGKMISFGTKSLSDAKHDMNYAAKRLAQLGLVNPTKISVRLQNIVAVSDLGHAVDLDELAKILPNIIYEPEQFPAAIHYAKDLEGASVLIFSNGKLVFAGLRKLLLLEVASKVADDIRSHCL